MEALNPTNIVPNQVGAIWTPLYDTYTKVQATALPATITFFGNLASSVGLQNTNHCSLRRGDREKRDPTGTSRGQPGLQCLAE